MRTFSVDLKKSLKLHKPKVRVGLSGNTSLPVTPVMPFDKGELILVDYKDTETGLPCILWVLHYFNNSSLSLYEILCLSFTKGIPGFLDNVPLFPLLPVYFSDPNANVTSITLNTNTPDSVAQDIKNIVIGSSNVTNVISLLNGNPGFDLRYDFYNAGNAGAVLQTFNPTNLYFLDGIQIVSTLQRSETDPALMIIVCFIIFVVLYYRMR